MVWRIFQPYKLPQYPWSGGRGHVPWSWRSFFKKKVFGGHKHMSYFGPLVLLFWISGHISSGFQSRSGFYLIHFCGGECNIYSLRSTSGATRANLLTVSITAGPQMQQRWELPQIRTAKGRPFLEDDGSFLHCIPGHSATQPPTPSCWAERPIYASGNKIKIIFVPHPLHSSARWHSSSPGSLQYAMTSPQVVAGVNGTSETRVSASSKKTFRMTYK